MKSHVEDQYVSKPYKRIYEIDGYWFFIPKKLTEIVEYLYKNQLIKGTKIRLTKAHTVVSGSLPIINVNYEKLFKLLIEKKSSVNAHYYCEREKDFDKGVYADFYVLGNLNNNKIQFELWEIIGNGTELFYSHFIQNINSNTFKHFDLATHITDKESNIENLFLAKQKPKIIDKIKWFRNDYNFSKDQILDITKLFFPLENLVDEFLEKKYS